MTTPFRLNAEQAVTFTGHADAIRTAHEALAESVQRYNEHMASCWQHVQEAQEALALAVENASEFVADVANEQQGVFDERSEKWQEGDRGAAVADWISTWESVSLESEELSEPDPLDEPGDVDDLLGEYEALELHAEGFEAPARAAKVTKPAPQAPCAASASVEERLNDKLHQLGDELAKLATKPPKRQRLRHGPAFTPGQSIGHVFNAVPVARRSNGGAL